MGLSSYPTNVPPIDPAIVKRRLNYARSRLDLTQEDLAKMTGISRSSIGTTETACNPSVPFVQIVSLAKALNVSPMWLIGFDNTMPDDAEEIEMQKKNGVVRVIVSKERASALRAAGLIK